MDDEEYDCQNINIPLYRVETGNYEYRLILRCRQEARKRFAALRSDVLIKLELLDSRHVQDIVSALQRLNSTMSNLHLEYHRLFESHRSFPVEIALTTNWSMTLPEDNLDSHEESDLGEDALNQTDIESVYHKPLTNFGQSSHESYIENPAIGNFTADDLLHDIYRNFT